MNQEHEVLAQSFIPALDGPVSVGCLIPLPPSWTMRFGGLGTLFRIPSLPDGLFQLDWRQEVK